MVKIQVELTVSEVTTSANAAKRVEFLLIKFLTRTTSLRQVFFRYVQYTPFSQLVREVVIIYSFLVTFQDLGKIKEHF